MIRIADPEDFNHDPQQQQQEQRSSKKIRGPTKEAAELIRKALSGYDTNNIRISGGYHETEETAAPTKTAISPVKDRFADKKNKGIISKKVIF